MSDLQQIPVKSPIAIIGAVLSVVRERFKPGCGLPWEYAQEGSAAHLDNSITIEAGSPDSTELTNTRPSVHVVRGPIGYKQSVIGDIHATHDPSGGKVYYATADTSFTFIVEAEVEGEAAQIADIVLGTFMMGSDLIEHAYQFRKLGPFSVSAASRPTYNTDICQIQVSMGLTFDVRWGTVPIAPMLNEIVVKMKNSTYNSNEAYFNEIYRKSFRQKS